jgi:hypothetical protein
MSFRRTPVPRQARRAESIWPGGVSPRYRIPPHSFSPERATESQCHFTQSHGDHRVNRYSIIPSLGTLFSPVPLVSLVMRFSLFRFGSAPATLVALEQADARRRNRVVFRERARPNPTRSAAPGRSILCGICASMVKHNPVHPVNRV